MGQLEGRCIFITGSGGVLGSTYVRRMLAEGAQVVATDLPGHRFDGLQDAHADNPNFAIYPLDVSSEQQIVEIFKTVEGDGWQPDVVLNNAAITGEMLMGAGGTFPDFADTTLEDWEKTMRTNLTGAFLVARAYGVTKAGIHGLTVWLAGYWAKRQATVNTIAPGAVFNGHSDEFQKRVGELIMAGRMCEPDEIADAMLFLASKASGYMTGQMINVDGGFSAW